ncbi:hypothetical protein L596_021266 [Steinernema carpocapsae]|uniref:Uncharacterized protein n=1 Tax=Steinernema carpocapsae TaxID=34508 RepID=A0A4V6XVW1_STECR|nr:hypothetical protein L596_021266 [Steinernema carpocapsae]
MVVFAANAVDSRVVRSRIQLPSFPASHFHILSFCLLLCGRNPLRSLDSLFAFGYAELLLMGVGNLAHFCLFGVVELCF